MNIVGLSLSRCVADLCEEDCPFGPEDVREIQCNFDVEDVGHIRAFAIYSQSIWADIPQHKIRRCREQLYRKLCNGFYGRHNTWDDCPSPTPNNGIWLVDDKQYHSLKEAINRTTSV